MFLCRGCVVVQSGLHTEYELEPEEGDKLRNIDVNFSAKTVRTQSGRVIGLSMRAMQSYSS